MHKLSVQLSFPLPFLIQIPVYFSLFQLQFNFHNSYTCFIYFFYQDVDINVINFLFF